MRFYFLFVLLIITFFSCKQDHVITDSNYAYVGGEIINPNTNYIVLSKDQKILDTVKLNGVNRFIYKIDSLNQGVYTFKHGLESQIIFL